MGKKGSYSDAVPTTKIVIQHNRNIEEGEQRYRNVAKIFVENSEGERFAVPTTKPGIARVYARHIAEGGTPYDEKGKHITSLVEEYSKMAGFVRATRNGQFNESAQQLVNEGINHYQSLRETLSRMTGHRGYSAYFESWTPPLMEDETEENNLNELFVQETLDPRIESVMPILNKLHKKVAEMKEVGDLAEWADKLTEAPGAETLAHDDDTEESNLKAFGLAEDDNLQEPAIDELEEGSDHSPVAGAITRRILSQRLDLLKKYGPVAVTQAIDDVADFVGDTEEIGSSDVSGWVRQVAQSLGSKIEEALDPEKKQRLDDLISRYEDATDPEDMGDERHEDIIAQIRIEFGDKTADSVENGPSMHFPRPGHSMDHDDLEFRQMRKNTSPNRITKLGKLHKQDSDTLKRDIKSNLDVEEGIMDTVKKVGSKVFDKLGGGSEEDLIRDLQKSAGVKVTGKKPEFDVKAKELARSNPSDPAGNFMKGGKDLGIFKEAGLDPAQQAAQKINMPASQRKAAGGDWKVTSQDLAKADEKNMTSPAGMKALKARMSTTNKLPTYAGDTLPSPKNAGDAHPLNQTKRVKESEFAGDYATGEAGQWRNKGPKANKPATIGDLVGEGTGNLAKAISKLGGWYQEDSLDPNIEKFEYDDREGGYYASGSIEHNLKTGEIEIHFQDSESDEEIDGTFNSIGDAMNALRGGYPGSHGGRAQNYDSLANKTLFTPDDVYKTDRAGKKGTLTKARMDGMKASSAYTMRGGPKGNLPEGQEDLDTIKRLLSK
jgi:hypothetical protein